MNKILLVGHSHANAVVSAIRRWPELQEVDSVEVVASGSRGLIGGLVLTTAAGKKVINPLVAGALERTARTSDARVTLVSLLGGNHALQLGLFNGRHPWSIAGTGGSGERVPLPKEALREAFRVRLQPFTEFMNLACKAVAGGVIHIESPPPVYSAEFILSTLPEKAHALAADNGIGKVDMEDIASPEHRLAVWRCQSEVVREIVAGAGGTYLLPPASAVDSDGYLADGFRKDPSHGNAAYGREVLAMLKSSLKE